MRGWAAESGQPDPGPLARDRSQRDAAGGTVRHPRPRGTRRRPRSSASPSSRCMTHSSEPLGAELRVEVERQRVPVECGPLEPRAAALDRDLRDPARAAPPPTPDAAMLRRHVQVLEPDPGTALPGREASHRTARSRPARRRPGRSAPRPEDPARTARGRAARGPRSPARARARTRPARRSARRSASTSAGCGGADRDLARLKPRRRYRGPGAAASAIAVSGKMCGRWRWCPTRSPARSLGSAPPRRTRSRSRGSAG